MKEKIKTIVVLTITSPIIIMVGVTSAIQEIFSPYKVRKTSWGYCYVIKER